MKGRLDSAHSHRKPSSAGSKKRGSGLPWVERGAQPFRTARPVVGLRRVFRAIETACSDGFRRECAESLQAFMNEWPNHGTVNVHVRRDGTAKAEQCQATSATSGDVRTRCRRIGVAGIRHGTESL